MNQEPSRALFKAAVVEHQAKRMKEWLKARATVAELEAKHMYRGKPFGFMNVKWEAFKGK